MVSSGRRADKTGMVIRVDKVTPELQQSKEGRSNKYPDLFVLFTPLLTASTSYWLNPMEGRGQGAHVMPPIGAKLPGHRAGRKGTRHGWDLGLGSEVSVHVFWALSRGNTSKQNQNAKNG